MPMTRQQKEELLQHFYQVLEFDDNSEIVLAMKERGYTMIEDITAMSKDEIGTT